MVEGWANARIMLCQHLRRTQLALTRCTRTILPGHGGHSIHSVPPSHESFAHLGFQVARTSASSPSFSRLLTISTGMFHATWPVRLRGKASRLCAKGTYHSPIRDGNGMQCNGDCTNVKVSSQRLAGRALKGKSEGVPQRSGSGAAID